MKSSSSQVLHNSQDRIKINSVKGRVILKSESIINRFNTTNGWWQALTLCPSSTWNTCTLGFCTFQQIRPKRFCTVYVFSYKNSSRGHINKHWSVKSFDIQVNKNTCQVSYYTLVKLVITLWSFVGRGLWRKAWVLVKENFVSYLCILLWWGSSRILFYPKMEGGGGGLKWMAEYVNTDKNVMQSCETPLVDSR